MMPRLTTDDGSPPFGSPNNGSPPSHPPPKSFLGRAGPSWSLPGVHSSSPPLKSASTPSSSHSLSRIEDAQGIQQAKQNGLPPNCSTASREFLDWKRLHLSKAKLSVTTKVAAIMAGFSVVSTVELQINDDADPYLLTAFTVTTTLLVCTTMMAIMISTCILPHIQVVAQLSPDLDAKESPHDIMIRYIDLSWVLANTCSLFLFTLDVILLCWIKFTYFSVTASWCATAILCTTLVGMTLFGLVFFRNVVKHQYDLSDKKYQQLEEMKKQLDFSSRILNV